MQKLYSELIGMPVLTEYSAAPIALIKDIIIDPENGKILAFCVKNNRIVAPLDIEAINTNLFVADRDRIVPINEILRAETVSKMDICVIGARVLTERGKKCIGRVVDYSIDAKHMILSSIYCAKSFFFFRLDERIISYKNIVKISKNIVIIKDSTEFLATEKVSAREGVFAS
ncbi:PRC-barrel domain-containing protein [Candidatus Peregrinibacteria bacterium]|nr:PRC-barrel domain-containing protein [Candidatus Peregrinibacteria bacterium]